MIVHGYLMSIVFDNVLFHADACKARKTSQAAARPIGESDAGAAGSTRARTIASLRLAWLMSTRRPTHFTDFAEASARFFFAWPGGMRRASEEAN